MEAAVLAKDEKNLVIEEFQDPKAANEQAKVRIEACGICGSDVHLILHGSLQCSYSPCIPGHEAAGVVEDVGPKVSKFQPGDRVVLSPGTSCGQCKHCRSGHQNLCAELGVFGFNAPGSFAEYNVVAERYLYRLPDDISFEQGAILADAVSTPYHALRFRGGLKEGESVAVFGCGGLGIHAVAVAKALGAGSITAVDIDEGALENARKYGADHAINAKEVKSVGKQLKKVAGSVDVAADFSGHMPNVQEALRVCNRGARIVLVGIGRDALKISLPFALIERQISLIGSYGSDQRAIPELIELIQAGQLDLSQSITSRISLNQINQGLQALRERRGNPIRIMVTPHLR